MCGSYGLLPAWLGAAVGKKGSAIATHTHACIFVNKARQKSIARVRALVNFKYLKHYIASDYIIYIAIKMHVGARPRAARDTDKVAIGLISL